MPTWTPGESLADTVRPLTDDEKRAIRRLENALLNMPRNMLLVTGGDAGLQVLDADHARQIDIHDGKAREAGIVLADVRSGCRIAGVSV